MKIIITRLSDSETMTITTPASFSEISALTYAQAVERIYTRLGYGVKLQ